MVGANAELNWTAGLDHGCKAEYTGILAGRVCALSLCTPLPADVVRAPCRQHPCLPALTTNAHVC